VDKRKVFSGAHPHRKFEAYPQLWIVKAAIIDYVSGKKVKD
jgi:hypothetical protein